MSAPAVIDTQGNAPTLQPGAFEREFGLTPNNAREDAGTGTPRVVDVEEGEEEEGQEGVEGEEGDEERDPAADEEDAERDDEPEGDEDEGEEGQKPEEMEYRQILADLPENELQDLLDALMEHPAAADLQISYRAGGGDRREALADVRQRAAGYHGEEEVTKLSTQVKAREAAIKAREEDFASYLNQPDKLVDFLVAVADDPLKYFQTLVAKAGEFVKDAEENPAVYRATRIQTATSRQLTEMKSQFDRVVALLQEGKAPSREGAPARRETAMTEEQRNEVGRERETAIKDWGERTGIEVSITKIGEAYVRAGQPADFNGWWKHYRETRIKPQAVKQQQRERAGGAPRRTGGSRTVGGEGKGRSAARTAKPGFPSTKEIDDYMHGRVQIDKVSGQFLPRQPR